MNPYKQHSLEVVRLSNSDSLFARFDDFNEHNEDTFLLREFNVFLYHYYTHNDTFLNPTPRKDKTFLIIDDFNVTFSFLTS